MCRKGWLSPCGREGVAAWQELQQVLRELTEANRQQLWAHRPESGRGSRHQVRRQHEQRSVFEMILPDGDQLWGDTLRRVDEILEDENPVDRVEDALALRRPKSPLDRSYP